MLLEENKTRIRAEEIFRQEVRREIESRKTEHSRGKQFWSLLNSSFALWFLSSVVLASLTAAITMHQRSHADQMQKAEVQRRLNTEIGSRVAEGLVALRLDLKRIESGKKYFAGSIYTEAASYLDNRVTDGQKSLDVSIYPEYQKRGFRSLIFELGGVVEQSAFPMLRDAQANYKRLIDLSDQASVEEDYSQPPPDKNVTRAAILKSIETLEHLQDNSFWQHQL